MAVSKFWKRTAFGCGGCVVLFILSGLLIMLLAVLDPPKESEFKEIGLTDSVNRNLESKPGMFGGKVTQKPMHLKFDLQYSKVKIMRGDQLGQVVVKGKYDTNNFELLSEVEEKADRTEATYTFKSRRNFISMIIGMSNEQVDANENEITILLPADTPLDMDYNFSKGETEMDLTGLNVIGLQCETSMGEFSGIISAPNPSRFEKFKHDARMGSTSWQGLENLGAANVRFSGRMGDVNVIPLGPMREDMNIQVDFSMGEVDVLVPKNANAQNSASVTGGDSTESGLVQDQAGAPKLSVSGKILMGGLRVRRLTEFEEQITIASDLAIHGSIDEASQAFRDLKQKFPDETRPDKLNNLGYRLLHRTPERAVAVFRLNVELHPHYANGYDSLGEALYENGQLEEALVQFRKAYDMDPSMTTSARWIKKIEGKLKGKDNGDVIPPKPPDPP